MMAAVCGGGACARKRLKIAGPHFIWCAKMANVQQMIVASVDVQGVWYAMRTSLGLPDHFICVQIIMVTMNTVVHVVDKMCRARVMQSAQHLSVR